MTDSADETTPLFAVASFELNERLCAACWIDSNATFVKHMCNVVRFRRQFVEHLCCAFAIFRATVYFSISEEHGNGGVDEQDVESSCSHYLFPLWRFLIETVMAFPIFRWTDLEQASHLGEVMLLEHLGKKPVVRDEECCQLGDAKLGKTSGAHPERLE